METRYSLWVVNVFAIGIGLLGISSCKDNSNPAPKTTQLITVDVAADYPPTGSRIWIAVHDTEGKLLESDSLPRGKTTSINTTKVVSGNTVSVTFFVMRPNSTSGSAIYSYLQVPIGTTWHKPASPGRPASDFDGYFTFNLTNCPPAEIDDYFFDGDFPNNKIGTLQNFGYSLSATNLKHARGDTKYIIAVNDHQGQLRYKILGPVGLNSVTDLSYGDLIVCPSTVKFDVPGTTKGFFTIIAIEPDPKANSSMSWVDGHQIRTSFLQSVQSFTAGYPPEFTNYFTLLDINVGTHTFSYQKIGSPPSHVSLNTSVIFKVVNNSIQDFKTDQSGYIARQSAWGNDDASNPVSWFVISPPGDQKFLTLPDGLIKEYPFLTFQNFSPSGSGFLIMGDTYDQILEHAKADDTDGGGWGTETIIVGSN